MFSHYFSSFVSLKICSKASADTSGDTAQGEEALSADIARPQRSVADVLFRLINP